MKFQFLGTAASEGFPALFCNCKYCNEARLRGGKNIRTRSQSIVNDELLIDFPADTYWHAIQNNLRLDKVKTLIVTHSHSDHFDAYDLCTRGHWFAHDLAEEKMHIVCNQAVYDLYLKDARDISPVVSDNLIFHVIKPFDSLTLGDYVITALPARHSQKPEQALFYVIQSNGKTILYAHDTGYFFKECFDFIKSKGYVFDFATFDCTNVDGECGEEWSHMSFTEISKVVQKLRESGAITDKTLLYSNHFSHNGNPLHEETCKIAKTYGVEVSYDGLSLEF
ncbi:MAG: hypothetical protein IJW58_02305 [Clostridia bacterium]|nr:hypothetical protein [Clostridia bacterium]